jgi:hypothetical protein
VREIGRFLGTLVLSFGCRTELPAPAPDGVQPDFGYNGEDTFVVISGDHFYPQVEVDAASRDDPDVNATYRVWLESAGVEHSLSAVTLVDYHNIQALVPPGITPGIFDLWVLGPMGAQGELSDGFLVTDTLAHALSIDVEGTVSYPVYETAFLTVQLVDPQWEPVFDAMEVRVTVDAEDGEVDAEFGDHALDEQQSLTDAVGIRGKLRSDGSARVGLTVASPDLVTIGIEPMNARSGVSGGSIKLEWEPGAATGLTVSLPEDPLQVAAGQTFAVTLALVDTYGNPADAVETVLIGDGCQSWISNAITVDGQAVVDVTLTQATDARPSSGRRALRGSSRCSRRRWIISRWK